LGREIEKELEAIEQDEDEIMDEIDLEKGNLLQETDEQYLQDVDNLLDVCSLAASDTLTELMEEAQESAVLILTKVR
jgi:hypothetical protein